VTTRTAASFSKLGARREHHREMTKQPFPHPAARRCISSPLGPRLARWAASAGLVLATSGGAVAQLIYSGDASLMSPPLGLPNIYDARCCLEWDFDGDGYADLLVGKSNSLHLLRNEGCSGVFTEVQGTLLAFPAFGGFPNPGVFCGDVGDVNGDGFDDAVISTTIFPNPNWIILGGNGPTLTTVPLSVLWPTLNDIELVDLTAANAAGAPPLYPLDGQLDLVGCSSTTWNASGPGGTIAYTSPGSLRIAAGRGGAGGPLFVDRSPPAAVSTTGAVPDTFYTSVTTGDFDGDGRPDVLVTGSTGYDRFFANWLPAVTRLYTNDPNSAVVVDATAGAFAAGTAQQGHNQAIAIDYDDDGDIDLVTFNAEPVIPPNPVPSTQITTYLSNLRVLLNNGPAAPVQFAAAVNLTAVCVPAVGSPCLIGGFVAGDLTNDGRMDLVHPAGVLIGTAGAAMVFDPGYFGLFGLGESELVGAIYDLDCNGRNDLVCSSLAGSFSTGIVAYLDPRGRLDGSPNAISVQNSLLATFGLLNPNALFGYLVVADAEVVPGVTIPGFSGLVRLGGNVIIVDDGAGGPSLVPGGAVALPENTGPGGPFYGATLYFQSFEFLASGEIVLSNVVRTAF